MTQDPYSGGPPTTGTGAGTGNARTLTIIGFVCAVIAVLILPILFGPAAIALGIVAERKGDPLGRWAAVAGAIGMVLGFILGAAIFAANND